MVRLKQQKEVKLAKDLSQKQFNVSDFVHLHNHTHYSLLDGLQKVPQMLDRVKDLKMAAVAVTDHGTLSGIIEFYKEAKGRGIKPIIGIETYIAPRQHTDKVGKEDANPFHLILLAMNNEGYENLMRLSSIAHLEGFYYKPRVDHSLLEKYNTGLIALSGCLGGELGEALQAGQTKKAKELARWYKKVFGDRYYLELQDHAGKSAEQRQVNNQLITLSQELDIPLVVTADAHYSLPSDKDAHEVLLCVQTGSLLSDEKRMSLKDYDLFVSDPVDIASRWQDQPEALVNTKAIADRCDVTIEFGKILIPKFPTPNGIDGTVYLEEKAYQGMAWRYGGKTRAEAQKLSLAQASKLADGPTLKRLRYELDVIREMGFAGYFLIVADFINWAKEKGIIIGPGRGSAAGSIVSYVLNITDLDPIKYDLLFERFLNPDRIAPPDIDIDFQDDRRDEVIRYVENKYGKDRVAHIVTFGKMAARNAIRDTARVLGVAYADADRLAKMIPPPSQGRHVPLAIHLEKVPELKNEYQTNPRLKEVIDLAIRLEGTIRSHGVHAAGVVIAPEELTKLTPLEVAQKGVVATQYSMGPIEDLGLLKMDFLGLSNLTILKNALRIIRKVYKNELELTNIPLDDQKTYKLFADSETTGVFQFESVGMKRYLKELKPNRFEDIIAMVALYRPGPMAEIPRFIVGKNDPQTISYLHEALQPVLEATHGVMVYQEQITAMLQLIAGYTPGQADLVRKAIGKQKRDIMEAEKPRFMEGSKKRGLSTNQAEKLWSLIQPFADYSFNKSHAACYATIAYWTAYLKAHYPLAFMAALLTSDFENTDRVAIELRECRDMEIPILPPDINESFIEFGIAPSKKAIRFALSAIKNVGSAAAEAITEVRKVGGAYKSIADFAKRVSPQHVNRKTWESLIKAGAFDQLADRSDLLFNLDTIISFASKLHKQAATGQVDLFGGGGNTELFQLELVKAPDEIADRERLQWERQLLGVYLSHHPLDSFEAVLSQKTTSIAELNVAMDGREVTVGGMVTAIRRIITRSGEPMAFVSVEDLTGTVELIVFPKSYKTAAELLDSDRVVLVSGKLTTKDRDGHSGAEIKVFADKVTNLEDIKPGDSPAKPAEVTANDAAKRLVIRVSDPHDQPRLAEMRQLLELYPGQSEVVIQLEADTLTEVRLPMKVEITADLKAKLADLFTAEAVLAA